MAQPQSLVMLVTECIRTTKINIAQQLLLLPPRNTGIDSDIDCTAQVKSASLSAHAEDGAFAVMDGGRSPQVPDTVRSMLEATLIEELAMDDKEREEGYINPDPLQYLSHTFLTLHRQSYIHTCS